MTLFGRPIKSMLNTSQKADPVGSGISNQENNNNIILRKETESTKPIKYTLTEHKQNTCTLSLEMLLAASHCCAILCFPKYTQKPSINHNSYKYTNSPSNLS